VERSIVDFSQRYRRQTPALEPTDTDVSVYRATLRQAALVSATDTLPTSRQTRAHALLSRLSTKGLLWRARACASVQQRTRPTGSRENILLWTASGAASITKATVRLSGPARRRALWIASDGGEASLSVATDASDTVGVNALISNAGTRGMRRSDGRYCAASIGSATDAPVQRLSPPFLLFGEANG
jgi:hypothetical protein